MATIVQKYGGSSVADVTRLKTVAAAVVARHRQGNKVVVVVSAMGKSTDGLIAQARDIATNPPRRELDMLVTAGERISMALLSMAIDAAGESAISFTGSQSGIITDEQHQGAKILEVRPARIETALGLGKIVIVAGYQGVSRQHEVTTLGRGGSDTTAVALAAALHAEACEIYSDVDGVYSADPNVCAQARLLPTLPFDLMQTMAGAGARVLNADAVEFARRADIRIMARQTADSSTRHTAIFAAAPVPSGVVAVVGHAWAIGLRASLQMPAQAEFQHDLGACGARVMAACPSYTVVDLTGVVGKDGDPVMALAQARGLHAERVGVVSLVGAHLMQQALPRALQTLAAAALPVLSWMGCDTCLALVVEPAAVDKAVRCLHSVFVENA